VIVLDTTVLLYAVGGEHPYAAPCRRLFEGAVDGRLAATTTAETIQEFVHVRARRRGRADAVGQGRDFAAILAPLLPTGDAVVGRALELFERHERLGAFDAFLAAAALEGGADALVSADAGFRDVPELTWVDPTTEGVGALLDA
jgi:predicted nucleic acid-binding protein